MNDVEHDLRELLDRKASSVGTVAPKLPEHVRKRSRRRELGTVLVSGLTVFALVIGSLAAVRALSESTDRTPTPAEDPWAGYDVFQRTATIETLTITSPSDWYLVNQWPMGARAIQDSNNGVCSVTVPPDGGEQVEGCSDTADGQDERSFPMLPILMLSNADLGLGPSACLDGGLGLQGDAAVLEVAVDTRTVDLIEAGNGPDLPGWPVPFDPNDVTDGPCGEGHYVRFQVGRYPYIAWAGFGPDASPEVREALFEIAGTLEIDDEAFVQGTLQKTPGYVIAGGENAAGPWRLELRPSSSSRPAANVELSVVSSEGAGTAADFSVSDEAPIEQAGGDPTFGAVTKEASGVELRLEEGTPPIPAQVVPLPPSMPFDFDLFFASNDSDVQAQAVPIGMPQRSTASPDPDEALAELRTVHDHLETALQRLWTELAYVDELEGEIAAAERELAALADEIGSDGPTEQQADRMRENQDLIVRFRRSMTERLESVASLRVRSERLREDRSALVDKVDPALLPATVTVTCTGDREGGIVVSDPAVLAQDDGVHLEVMNTIPNERVLLDLGAGLSPIEVEGGQRVEVVQDGIESQTIELACTYETPPGSWRRTTHPLTVIAASS